MKRGFISLMLCMFYIIAFSNPSIEKEGDAEFYMDFVQNRLIYTKVSEMPKCKINFSDFLLKENHEYIIEKKCTDTHGEIAFILEIDGSIKQCWVIDSTCKEIDILITSKIKQGAKHWVIGKHNEKAVPVEIRLPYSI